MMGGGHGQAAKDVFGVGDVLRDVANFSGADVVDAQS